MMLWMDFETGGLDPKEACPIEIALVQTDKDGNVIRWYESKIKPSKPIHPAAAAVNGYTEERWKLAPVLPEVLGAVSNIFAGDLKYMPAGWNTPFDLKFWEYHGFSCQGKIKFGYHPYDLFGAYYPKYRWYAEKVRLEMSYERTFSKKIADAHTAMSDVKACIELYRELLK